MTTHPQIHPNDVRIGQKVMDGLNATHIVCKDNLADLIRIARHGNLRLVAEATPDTLQIAFLEDQIAYWRKRAITAESGEITAAW